jgi:tetratricopeptide (TPR) repeat protein
MRPALRRRAREWSRAAWALAALFATLPLSSRLFLGVWGFESAGALAAVCAVTGFYLHIQSRRALRELPDPSTLLEEALALGRSGHASEAEAVLTETIRVSPWVWEAFQYRAELRLARGLPREAIEDLNEAIKLRADEPQLYLLRAQAWSLLGDDAAARLDYDRAGVQPRT